MSTFTCIGFFLILATEPSGNLGQNHQKGGECHVGLPKHQHKILFLGLWKWIKVSWEGLKIGHQIPV